MGQIFGGQGLTTPNSALLDPSGRATFVGGPQQVLAETNRLLRQGNQGTDIPELQGILGTRSNAPLPAIGTPSFREAATAGAIPGSANALSPGLNKAGKLATLLMGGLQGALAGRAAQEDDDCADWRTSCGRRRDCVSGCIRPTFH